MKENGRIEKYISDSTKKIIGVKTKLPASKYTFNDCRAFHHLIGLSGYYKVKIWFYEFNITNKKQSESLLLLKLSNLIVFDNDIFKVDYMSSFFELAKYYEIAVARKAELNKNIAKMKAIYDYHKLVLEESDKEKLKKLRKNITDAEQLKRDTLFTEIDGKYIPSELQTVIQSIAYDLRRLFLKGKL